MAKTSLDDSLLTINLSLIQLDAITESLAKANALTQVILSVANLEDIASVTLHDFLWTLDDLIYQAVTVCAGMKAPSPL